MNTVEIYGVCFLMLVISADGNRVKRGFCPTGDLDIPNGNYRLLASNTVASFSCYRGYQLYGSRQLRCMGSKWSSDKPMCIANTCSKITATANMTIVSEYDGAVLKFTCSAHTRLSGSYRLMCDGKAWNDNPPVCESWVPPTECDFEDPQLCGWSHHDNTDVDWRWNTGGTSTRRTGPDHDHTLGVQGTGHYLYFESSSPTEPSHKAILISPKYLGNQSQEACFGFWYHIFGTGNIGDLELFFKPESKNLSDLVKVFQVSVNMGEDWQYHSLDVTPFSEPFQIVFIATRATSYKSDFAIDDVRLYSCPKPTTTTPTTTSSTTTTTPKSTTTTSTTTTTTRAKPPTAKLTNRTPNPPPVVTQTTRASTNITPNPSPVVTDITVTNTNVISTLKPIVNPDIKSSHLHTDDDTSGSSGILYILLGLGLVAAVALAVVVVIVFLRKRWKARHTVSFNASNPMYTPVREDQVQFVNDDGYDTI